MPRIETAEVLRILRASPLLDALPAEEIDGLATRVRRRHYQAGAIVFSKEAAGSHVYWVARGRFKLTVDHYDGSELLHRMLEVGEHFGEITAVDGGVRGVNAIAETEGDALAIGREHWLPAIGRHPKAMMKLAVALCAEVRGAGAMLESLAFHNSETRIWSRLIYLSQRYGSVDPATRALRIDHGLSQQDLADSVGITRIMVNRQLKIWRELKLTENGRGYIILLDPKALETHVWRRMKGGR